MQRVCFLNPGFEQLSTGLSSQGNLVCSVFLHLRGEHRAQDTGTWGHSHATLAFCARQQASQPVITGFLWMSVSPINMCSWTQGIYLPHSLLYLLKISRTLKNESQT